MAKQVVLRTLATLAIGGFASGCDPEATEEESGSQASEAEVETPDEPVTRDPAAESDPADPDADARGCAGPPEPAVTIAWVDAEGDAFTETKLSEPMATVRITNGFQRPVVAELSAVGDRGTTATVRVDGPALTLGVGQTADFELPLERFLAGDAPYSRGAHVSARIMDAQSGEALEKVISTDLSFHHDPVRGLLAYDDLTRNDKYGGGDVLGLAPVDPQDDGVRDGIVLYEPTGDSPRREVLRALQPDTFQVGAGPTQAVPPLPLGVDPPTQQANYPHNLCVELKIETTDSGFTNSLGIKEDVWADANDPVQKPAHGLKVKINGVKFDLNSDGCVTFLHPQPAFLGTVAVYTRSTLANGTYVRIHDGDRDSQASLPGTEFSKVATNVIFASGNPASVVQAGQYQARWTAMATLAKSLHRYSDDLAAGTEIHANDQYGCDASAQCDPDSEYCCDCSINANYANHFVNNETYLRFTAAACNGTSLRSKFLVGHEYGHAYGSQVANSYLSPATASHHVLPSTCEFDNSGAWAGVDSADTYDNETKEWSSIAFREGWAHFVSARIWNDKAADGQFRWGSSHDLERWDPSDTPRGVLKTCCPSANQTCADSLSGTGTITDWMRGLWDLHSDTCSDAPNRAEMATLYSDISNDGFQTDQTIYTLSEYYTALRLPTCGDDWVEIACHNGLDEQGVVQSGSCN